MNRNSLPTGEYRLPALNEFTVTVTSYVKKPKRKITWDEWFATKNYNVDFKMGGPDRNVLIFKTEKEPEDIELEMPENDPPYELVWAK